MSHPLRVGVIGCGAIAQIMHIPYLVEHERFELLSLCDTYPPILNAVADRCQIGRRHTDWHSLLAEDDLDAVVIAHAGSHHDSVMAALDAGKHVFVEKPLGWNVREVEEVAARAAQSDRTLQVGYHKLYDPGFVYARQQLEEMQDVAFARITVLHPDNDLGFSPHRIRRGSGRIDFGHREPTSWEQAVEGSLRGLAGGALAPLVDEALGTARKDDQRLRVAYGQLTISIIHQVYTMFGFLGEPVRVLSADSWRGGLSIHIVVEYPGDLRCVLDWHYLSHLKDYREEYAFYGSHDRVMLTFPSPYFRNFPSPVTVQGGEGELAWEKRIIVSYEEAFENELLAFYDNVQNQTMPISSALDALKHARFIQDVIDIMR